MPEQDARPADRPPPATFPQRTAARAARHTSAQAQPDGPRSRRCGPTLRVHVEEVPHDERHRPELLSSLPGKTLLEAVGPREVVACALRELGRRLDPPWWMFWARQRR